MLLAFKEVNPNWAKLQLKFDGDLTKRLLPVKVEYATRIQAVMVKKYIPLET